MYPHLVSELSFVCSTILFISFTNLFLFLFSIPTKCRDTSGRIEVLLLNGLSCEHFRSIGSLPERLQETTGKNKFGRKT